MESILCETPIISRPVGIAPDLLDPSCLFRNTEDGARILRHYLNSIDARKELVSLNSRRSRALLSRSEAIKRWEEAYRVLLG